MINLQWLLQFYPPHLHDKQKWILREYLQVKVLEYIFAHPLAQKLCFIGGTALRLVYKSSRFSEDLDFDNRDLTEADFETLTLHIRKSLLREWYEVETKVVYKWAFHCEIKLPSILYENNLALLPTQKLVIKIDTAAQWFSYSAIPTPFQMFEYAYLLKVVPKDVLLSMKFLAFFNREKWRDIFDIVYLLGMNVRPNMSILKKLDIQNWNDLKKRILARVNALNMDQLNADVQPFLFQSTNQSVKLFPEFIKQIEFE